ncbi:uncharacterized protein LOC132644350 [Lycium barbarum]|uniref:uncharacterized protein LOC132644350 n=1 Tax=Lycium barbarum TaxID=112863 RepID=UPI00293F24D5|nr:uncharacterized protein LOC132644350 [Lycium barbarum]
MLHATLEDRSYPYDSDYAMIEVGSDDEANYSKSMYGDEFDSKDEYMHVLLDGSLIVLSHYLVVQPWKTDFSLTDDRINSIVAWVRFPGLLTHLNHKKVLRALGNKIDHLVKIDYNIAQCDRARFARIEVEVDLTKPLISYFEFKGKTQKVAYEGLPDICFHCGKFGHTINLCGDNPANVNKPPNKSDKAANSGRGGGEMCPTEGIIFMVPG